MVRGRESRLLELAGEVLRVDLHLQQPLAALLFGLRDVRIAVDDLHARLTRPAHAVVDEDELALGARRFTGRLRRAAAWRPLLAGQQKIVPLAERSGGTGDLSLVDVE